MRSLQGHGNRVIGIAFDPQGRTLASGADDSMVKLWDATSGELLRTLEGHKGPVRSVAFDSGGRTLASGGDDGAVRLWDVATGRLLRTLRGRGYAVSSVLFHPAGRTLVSGRFDSSVGVWDVSTGELLRTFEGSVSSNERVELSPTGGILACGVDQTVKLWDVASGRPLRTLRGHGGLHVWSVAFDPQGLTLASGGDDNTVRLWDVATGRLLRTLEGHTRSVEVVAFSTNGLLLASKSVEGELRFWNCATWEMVSVIPRWGNSDQLVRGLTFHPTLPLLATSGSKLIGPIHRQAKLINLWELDYGVLLGKAEAEPAAKVVHHTTAKIVLVGDHSVGKSGLGWRLAHGQFKEQASTHGQQFWVLPQLGRLREDGTECEAILWDLAGQPDYRLIHALFLDDVDLALVLFDSSDIGDPLHGVEFWLRQLQGGQPARPPAPGGGRAGCPTILVGAQADRGTPALTLDELREFCGRRGIGGYVSTSAKEGWGLNELTEQMKVLISWEDKPATVTTVTFKRIKDYVLKLKEGREEGRPLIVTPQELRRQLEETEAGWRFTDAELATAVGHLENYGYVKQLRTSKGEERVLLAPELLNNLAASFVLEARRNPRGLGSLEEKRLLAGEYPFPELKNLSPGEREILLDSAALLFLEHNVCFRETDPLGGQSYLVFPELINLKKPVLEDELPTEDGAAYTVSGAVENVYASLVVLLGYTQTFTRTDQWHNHARYEMGNFLICGFRQEAERDGELDFVLYFGKNVGAPVRTLFQGLFESFLARRNLNVFRYERVACAYGHVLDRGVVRGQLRKGNSYAFCSECGDKLALPKADEPIQLTQTELHKVDEQQWFAARRSLFERAVFQLMSYAEGEKLKRSECFISYAWGERGHERWVEKSLATDLQKAGIKILLDRWENSRIGANLMRFVERIEECDCLVVVGTPLYRMKARNVASEGSVVAAEWDLAGIRMLATEAEKKTVLPVLLAGDESESFPPLLRGRLFADFREEREYFTTAFDLILSIYNIPFNHRAVADLRESLRGSDRP